MVAPPTTTSPSRSLGAFGGDEEKNFNASLAAFEQTSGIDIQYVSDQDYDDIKQKVNSGDSPDIGLFPQPGGLIEFATQGKVQPIDTYLDYETLDSTLLPGFLDAALWHGRVYGAPMRNAVKSIVWYPKQAYEAGGWDKAPKTLQELQTNVADKIKATGISPWCMGWESDQATGWVGTDWIEELMLRMHGPDVYDDWSRTASRSTTSALSRCSTSSPRSPRTRRRCSGAEGRSQHRVR